MKSKIKTLISNPGHLFRYRSFIERKIYFHFSKYLHLNTFLKRRYKKTNNLKTFNNGFLKLSPEDLKLLGIDSSQIIEEINKQLNKLDNKFDYSKSINVLLSSENFDVDSKAFKFITNENLIDIISNYLGLIPLLTHISYWYSPNQKDIENSSQEYHLDHEDIKQVKGFFLIDDVSDDSGPTIFLNSKNSKKILNKIKYRTNENSKRIDESFINKEIENKIKCTGKKGTLFLIDTSNCFHCGSRKSDSPRKILAFQFITAFSTSLKWNWKKSKILNKPFWKSKDLSKKQKLVVGME